MSKSFFTLLLFFLVHRISFSQTSITQTCTYSVTTLSNLPNTTANTTISGCSYKIIGCTSPEIIAAVGIVWSPDPGALDYNWLHPQSNSAIVQNNMEYTIKNLVAGTTYYVRAFIFSGKLGHYEFAKAGNVTSVTTQNTDGTWPITNNSITSGNQYFCLNGSVSQYTLTGSLPVLGNNGTASQPDPNTFIYQWQSSIDGVSYNTITGATSQNYSPTQSTPGTLYYRRLVTYTSTGTKGLFISNTYSSTPASVIYANLPTTSAIVNVRADHKGAARSMYYFLVSGAPDHGGMNLICDIITSTPWPNGYTTQFLESTNEIPSSFTKVDDPHCSNCQTARNFCEFTMTTNGVGCAVTYTSPVIGITPTDGDRNFYPYVKIGSNYWMTENLATTTFNDRPPNVDPIGYKRGTPIANVTLASAWTTTATPAYCLYNNSGYVGWQNDYGLLYNFYTISDSYLTVNSHSVCPVGWHVATTLDWQALETTVGGPNALKETGSAHWKSGTNTNATNKFNFNALPGGWRYNGNFMNFGDQFQCWKDAGSASTFSDLGMNGSNGFFNNGSEAANSGFSIRCVKNP